MTQTNTTTKTAPTGATHEVCMEGRGITIEKRALANAGRSPEDCVFNSLRPSNAAADCGDTNESNCGSGSATPLQTSGVAAAAANSISTNLNKALAEQEEKARAKHAATLDLAKALRPILSSHYDFFTERYNLRPEAVFDALIRDGYAEDFLGAVYIATRHYIRSGEKIPPEIQLKIDKYFSF